MALKKSELYSSLWSSCDELRGSMDASQYKDYALVLVFVKYVSDKYAGQPFAPIKIPPGASFADMVALKGKSDIGDQINKKILGPLARENNLSDMPDFDDPKAGGVRSKQVEGKSEAERDAKTGRNLLNPKRDSINTREIEVGTIVVNQCFPDRVWFAVFGCHGNTISCMDIMIEAAHLVSRRQLF